MNPDKPGIRPYAAAGTIGLGDQRRQTAIPLAAQPELNSATVCAVCGHRWEKMRTKFLLTPEAQNQEIGQFMQQLIQHIQQAHPESFKHVQIKGMEFLGFMLLGMFRTDDESLQKQHKDYVESFRKLLGMKETETA